MSTEVVGKQLGFVIDLRRCVGCRTCVIGCKMENSVPMNKFRIRVLNPQNTMAYDKPSGEYPNIHIHWLPFPCQHCGNAPCVKECSTGAMQKREKDGIVIIDKYKCLGCRFCVNACPYDVLLFNEETKIVDKCDMCVHRVDNGLEPFCVTICPSKAIGFSEMNVVDSEARRILKARKYMVLKKEKRTNPSVYYLLP